mgnify:FL=1
MEKFPHRVLYNALGRPYFSLRVQKGESRWYCCGMW